MICFLFCLYIRFLPLYSFFFFFNDTATTEIYTLSLHDALPIQRELGDRFGVAVALNNLAIVRLAQGAHAVARARSEEHTSELQSLAYLVCRLLLEKKKKKNIVYYIKQKKKKKKKKKKKLNTL